MSAKTGKGGKRIERELCWGRGDWGERIYSETMMVFTEL